MMVWNGRLPGATRFGLAATRLKPWPRFCIDTPQPGTTTPEPKPMKLLWMKLTIMPRSSAAVR